MRGLACWVVWSILPFGCGGPPTSSEGPRVSSASRDLSDRMRGLLGVGRIHGPVRSESVETSIEEDVVLEDIRFESSADVWVTAKVVKPAGIKGTLPAVVCLPGTHGTRQHLTDARLQIEVFPRTGWARALARKGFVTLSVDYQGSESRGGNIFADGVRAQLEGRSFMGALVGETLRAVDYLQSRPDVDSRRIGITGFSLGGAVAWYAAACDPRLSVVVPVCGGAGTYDDLLKAPPRVQYHSQYFYPAGFFNVFPGDQLEVFEGLAPRPVLIVGRDQDQAMPIEGVKRLEEHLKVAYAKRGAADDLAVFVTPGKHSYTLEMLDRVCEWFVRHLKG